MEPILYFAYGSNMLEERLANRCRSAKVLGTAWVDGYTLAFSKKSKDGSGKATLVTSQDPAARVYGVIFSVSREDLPQLDKAEGNGYGRTDRFQVMTNEDRPPITAITYLALPAKTNSTLQPYDWYLQLIVTGARRGKLPQDYIDRLAAMPFIADQSLDRPSKIEAQDLLRQVAEGA